MMVGDGLPHDQKTHKLAKSQALNAKEGLVSYSNNSRQVFVLEHKLKQIRDHTA